MIHVRSKLKLGLGVVLTAALLCSLVLIAAPVGATDPDTLTKTITTADDLEVSCDNPMSGIVKFEFVYTATGGNAPQTLAITITGPTPYTAGQTIDLLLDASGTFSPGSEESMMEMGIVDRNGDNDLDVGSALADDIIMIIGTPPDPSSVTFWLDTEKNWSQDTDDLIMPDYEGIHEDWDRPAHTSVWPMGPCIGDSLTGQYNIVSTVYDASGQPLTSDEQDEPLYNDPYMMPSLGIDVKGSVQCFYAKNTGPDVVLDWTVMPGVNSPEVVIEGGGGTGKDWICISSAIPGDAIVKAYIDTNENGVADLVISGEKKWGDIEKTVLKADKTANIDVLDTVDIDEMVYALIHWGSMDPADEVVLPAGGALVHWWLLENTENENQEALIEELEAIFPNEAGDPGTVTDDHPYYEICGIYKGGPPDYVNPFDVINTFCTAPAHDADHTEFIEVEGVVVDGGTLTYVNSVSDDSMPWETTGWTQTTINFYEADSATGLAEEVMVVLLVEYPLINMFHGENPVCVEFVKITPEIEVTEVQPKSPQVAWAGEKIVIEKKWGGQYEGHLVTFTTDQDSIGSLAPIWPGIVLDKMVYTLVTDGVARCILETEYEGQAEVKCSLYDIKLTSEELVRWLADPGPTPMVIGNHDFPVFFLKLESVEAIGTYPAVDVETDVDFGIEVKGWFITKCTELAVDPDTGEVRAEKPVDVDGDGTIDQYLPRGRWVLPDDWSRLAGIYETRRHWDLMDNATDAIDSLSPLGPFNTDVVTTDPPGEAEKNVVGPFNTTQPAAIDPADGLLKWVATATVVGDDDLVTPDDLRCTVVPNGILEWQDCPMPAAYTEFTVSGTTLSEALKTGVAGYFTGTTPNFIYEWPFYYYEIPSSQFIPVGGVPEGYYWDSWGVWTTTATDDGAYEFWTDLGVSTVTTKLEVYTDNNGRAYVTMDARATEGSATISAIADYPYQRKHPAMKSETVTQTWGEVTDCLDSPPIEVGLESILADPVRRVVVYHEWAGEWTGFDTAAPAEANDLTTLEAGKGYWTYVSTDCTLDYYCNVHVLTGGLWYMIGWQDCCVD